MSSMNGWASVPTGTGVIAVVRRRRVAPIAGVAIAGMLVAMGMPLAATSASAAVITPGAVIGVFPARDFVMAEGYTPGSAHTVKVLRAGFTVGTVNAVANAAGFIEVNHPAVAPDVTNCWVGVTPDIRPGDVVQVLTGATVDATTTAGITLTQRATFAAGQVTLKGTAPGATAGTRIPEAQLEIRANAKNTKFAKNLRASLRADAAGTMDGVVAYDTPAGNTWTATFTGMDAVNPAEPDGLTDGARAVNSESVALTILNLQELTHAESGPLFVKGPALPDCTAPAAVGPSKPVMTAATDSGLSTTDGITQNQTPTFAGVASLPDSTSVSLFVDGVLNGNPLPLVVGSGGAYSFTPTAALAFGTHKIEVGETGPTAGAMLKGNVFASINIAALPSAPIIQLATAGNASVLARWTAPANGGSAITRFHVRAVDAATGTKVFALRDAAGSTASSLAIPVPNGIAVRIQVQAINALGTGAISAHSNGVIPMTTPSRPLIGKTTAGIASANGTWTATYNGGSVITRYHVRVVDAATGRRVFALRDVAASARSLRVGLPRGLAIRFQVAAINAAGSGLPSAHSNGVIVK
jgi:hypothetical protein